MARQLHISIPTICRVLHFQLKITLKKPTKLSLKASPFTQYDYLSILSIFYNPEQLLFVDECSVTSRDVHRRNAWSPLGKDACVGIKQLRGPRSISVLASFDVNGFVTWKSQKCAFTKNSFHHAFVETIIPIMNPFPLPRSIIVLDNCSIHHYTELEQVFSPLSFSLLISLLSYCANCVFCWIVFFLNFLNFFLDNNPLWRSFAFQCTLFSMVSMH